MEAIQRAAEWEKWETLSLFGRRKGIPDLPCMKCGNGLTFWLHVALTTAFDLHGRGSVLPTRKIIRIIEREQPDILQLHNIHGYYLNYPMLFYYLKNRYHGKVVWTLHDCWAYTGHCAFYTVGCDRWMERNAGNHDGQDEKSRETGCYHCPHRRDYPWSFGLDYSAGNWRNKRAFFRNVDNLTLVTPSRWIADNVQRSFLRDYPVEVIPNGTDLSIFCPGQGSRTYKVMNAEGRKILLGVASAWNERKGLQVFRELAPALEELYPGEYAVVVIGLNSLQRETMPETVTVIERTADQAELADYYSGAEILINPSLEESFSMVTVESLACGTPVIGLDTSAVGELILSDCGMVLHSRAVPTGKEGISNQLQPDIGEYIHAIRTIEERKRNGFITAESCRKRAEQYSGADQVRRYMNLYRKLLNDRK